ncbi:FAD-dependent glycerol-3-phosphate dehydrogenase [Synechococcus sp. A15-62]|uniref:glycerol-3-phosphate dehydrogenase/oxidase n=1 Tax=Synechococcus sp. A15-62 TaxID=1050657 RepID=UPI001644737D|nr:FAD-dependent oxidoreductase [Synechococcus sp. A15-62]QNI99395.1 FAD-dependent glycerol-3-phosphate dehydrogenase [Synechococcus sp. A15-62]
MADHQVDLLVIGAGASGASVAYEATRRGLSVALLEAGDIGGGTSCRSTKLLHGGVRYLELAFKTLDLAQLRLVREALLERSHWLTQAPFLARRLELALPTQQLWGQAYYRVGLGVYDALAGERSIGHSRLLSQQQMRQALPLLKACQGGVAYSDGQFDDARLNLLLALTAEQRGATLRTRCRVVELETGGTGQLKAAISESATGQRERWCASAFVNATGIRADEIRQMAEADAPPRMFTSRGAHIVLEQNLCPEGVGLLVPSTADGRVLFMLPFHGRTLVGTTDEACSKENATSPSPEEEAYLLNYVRDWFPQLQDPKVSSRWAGGRPLLKPADQGLDSSRVVREHEVETLACGLVSVMGGKWTTCRPMAEDTLTAVERQLSAPLPKPQSLPLLGTAANPEHTITELRQQALALEALLPDTPERAQQVLHLQHNFGLGAEAVVAQAPMEAREPLSSVIPICRAEIQHAIQKEHASSSDDVLSRRCRLAMVDAAEAERLSPLVNNELEQM